MGRHQTPYRRSISSNGLNIGRCLWLGQRHSLEKDLKGAFNLLNYNPDHCKLFAFPLINDMVVIHLAGLFG